MVEGVVNGQGGLLGLGQAVEVDQHLCAGVTQFVIELATRAQLQQIQVKPPPGQEAFVVGTGVLHACVGEAVEPGVEVGEEVAGGLYQGPAGDQGRPALSLRCRARARSRATVSRWISWSRLLRRLCSASHERTSGRSSLGT